MKRILNFRSQVAILPQLLVAKIALQSAWVNGQKYDFVLPWFKIVLVVFQFLLKTDMDLWNNKVFHHVLAIFMMKDSDIFLSDVNNVHIYNCWQIPDHFIPTFFNARNHTFLSLLYISWKWKIYWICKISWCWVFKKINPFPMLPWGIISSCTPFVTFWKF